MPKLFACIRCSATFDQMLIDAPQLCPQCASGQKVGEVLERASGAKGRPRTAIENRSDPEQLSHLKLAGAADALRISLLSEICAAATRAYGRHVGGSPDAGDAFGNGTAAAVTAEVIERALAAAAKARHRRLGAMPIDPVDD